MAVSKATILAAAKVLADMMPGEFATDARDVAAVDLINNEVEPSVGLGSGIHAEALENACTLFEGQLPVLGVRAIAFKEILITVGRVESA